MHRHAGAFLLGRSRALPSPSHQAAVSVAMVVFAVSASASNLSLAEEKNDPSSEGDEYASTNKAFPSAEVPPLHPARMNNNYLLPLPPPLKFCAHPFEVRSGRICMCEAANSNDDEVSASKADDGITSSGVASALSCSSSGGADCEYWAPSRVRRILASLRIAKLPTPRLLRPGDGAFAWPELRRGLRRRAGDENRLRELEKDAREAAKSGDRERVAGVARSICDVAYGRGVTPQDRQDFLIKYGCAAWNEEVLSVLFELGRGRGILELGAGLGQWARAISDYAASSRGEGGKERGLSQTRGGDGLSNDVDFVIAYDDMSSLPLSPAIYHPRTQPAHDHFYPRIREGNCGQALRSPDAQGRVLLLVFPPPGPMAADAVRRYADGYREHGNDTVVYVGEGRNGANADDAFFDMLENSGEWALLRVVDLPPTVGGKGFEKLFVLRRVSTPADGDDDAATDDINVNRALQWRG